MSRGHCILSHGFESGPDATKVTALEIATMYFKSGADKVSIGSDAVQLYHGDLLELAGTQMQFVQH